MSTLKMVIDGIGVEGTPQELATMISLLREKPATNAPSTPLPLPSILAAPEIKRSVTKRQKKCNVLAKPQKEIPYEKFVQRTENERAWAPKVIEFLNRGGWYRVHQFVTLLGIKKDDWRGVYQLRMMLERMQIGRLVVVRRSSPYNGSPLEFASVEEDATKRHEGLRVWVITK